ncbi:MAG: HepT-like ribonuclease domain-containing protein [Sarcina sp.]
MVYYKYKKEKLEEKFLDSKVFLVKIRECIKRNPLGEDDIIDEAMISYFNSFCEFIIDMCETYLVTTDNYIPNKSGPEIIELASTFGFINSKDSKKLQAIVKIRNRYTHDYYQRKLSKKVIKG